MFEYEAKEEDKAWVAFKIGSIRKPGVSITMLRSVAL
jgi:hypothetical protein